jgi:hypothetical protein
MPVVIRKYDFVFLTYVWVEVHRGINEAKGRGTGRKESADGQNRHAQLEHSHVDDVQELQLLALRWNYILSKRHKSHQKCIQMMSLANRYTPFIGHKTYLC